MSAPRLITPPQGPVVALTRLKEHCEVDGTHRDALLEIYETAAVAHLDGYRGVLGRAILPQVWAQDVDGPGPHLLALPDATAIEADGEAVDAQNIAIRHGGVYVTLPDQDGVATLEYSCALPDDQLPAAQVVVMMLVSHWYDTRSAVAVGSPGAPMPLGAVAMIEALRWRAP